MINFQADYKKASVRPSENFGDRRNGKHISMLILHYTGMETAQAAEERLKDTKAEVSAHYMVDEDGAVIQLVPESKRAWHAGRAFWQDERDINSCSIGIEIVNAADLCNWPPYPEAQIFSVIELAKDIIHRNSLIIPHNVLGHSDVAPERKSDPGSLFPWGKLAKEGVGLYTPPVDIKESQNINLNEDRQTLLLYQTMLARYGYNIQITGMYDTQTFLVTQAFQRHFRSQKIDGIVDYSTLKTLENLLNKLDFLNA